MKIFRFGEIGKEKPGVVGLDGVPRDASSFLEDYNEEFLGTDGLYELRVAITPGVSTQAVSSNWPKLDLGSLRLGAPVARPSKFLGVGLNYRDHATETGASVPSEPKLFSKATTSICGTQDALVLPRGSTHTDYEVELAVVMGKRANYVSAEEALKYVAGFTLCNDYSEREYQKNRAGQFVKGKSADTFGPLGPFLVTPDELDSGNVRIWCKVNGELRQEASTSEMIYSVAQLIENISQYMTLLPGDVITTGTPSGVGLARTPPVFLQAGDLVEYGADGIGAGRQQVVASPLER